MSYVQLLFKPYRGNLLEEINQILMEDIESVSRTIPNKGLIWFIGYILVTYLSALKVLHYIFVHFRKPERPIPEITRNLVDKEIDMQPYYQEREFVILSKGKKYDKNYDKTLALTRLRNYLYSHNLTLKGRIIKETNHKVSDHAFINSIVSGEDIPAFTTTYIAFEEEVNKMLSQILSSKPKKRTIKGIRCLAFENDYGYMLQELREIYQEPIKIQLDNSNSNNYNRERR